MLLLVLLLVHHLAGDLPKQTNYVTKKFDSCPSVGYFFKREENDLNTSCYLCFCQDTSEATCWPRENKKCDTKDYLYFGEKKRDTRLRRSPDANPLAADLRDRRARDSSGSPVQPQKDLQLPKKHRTRRRSYNLPIKQKKKYITKPSKTTTKPIKKMEIKASAHMKKKPQPKEIKPVKKTANISKKRPTRMSKPKTTRKPKKSPKKNHPKRNIQKKPSKSKRRQLSKDKKNVKAGTTNIRHKRKLNETTLVPLEVTQQLLNNKHFKNDLQLQISKHIMEKFQSAIQSALYKKLRKNKEKRSIAKKVIIKNEVDSNDTNYEIGAKWLENVDMNGGLMDDSNNVKIYQRYKRNVVGNEDNTTTPLNNAAEGYSSIPENKTEATETTERPPTTTAKDSYYKYSIENRTHYLTPLHDEDNMHESDNNSLKVTRSIQNLDQNLTVLQLIDNNTKIWSGVQKTDIKVLETTSGKVTSDIDTIYHVIPASNITTSTGSDNDNNITEHSIVSLADKIMNANDLKFSNWSQVKVLKEAQNFKSDNNTFLVRDVNVAIERQKVHSFGIGRKVGNLSKKHKLEKIVKVPHKPGKNKHLIYDQTNNNLNIVKNFINNIRISERKRSTKSNNVIKYLQKYFRKLFSRPKNKKKAADVPKKPTSLDKHLQTLCETFGPCYLNSEVELQLQSKIETLNTETYKMLRSIQIIHGLLKLIHFATNDKDLKGVNRKTKTYFKNDIKKLQAVLRGTFLKEENIQKLTNTEITQIDYIKKNAITFMLSAGKFAGILNDIIDIIHTQANHRKTSNRIHRFAMEKTKQDMQYSTLKDLLVKLNMVQNTFMKKIYQMLPNAKVPPNEEKKISMHDEMLNVAENVAEVFKETSNSSEAINIYTKNIIKNLRKLKNLAQRLEFKSGRRKRDLGDDDALEYLLMLMEYLLKQNHHLDSAPVNDGIDLLIEAIKHAPDIKPIRKKVLQNLPYIKYKTQINKMPQISTTTEYIELITIKDESSSDINTLSKEDNSTSKLDDLGSFPQSFDDEDNEIEKERNNNRKTFSDSSDDLDYYKNDDIKKSKLLETSTEPPLMVITKNEETSKNLEKLYSSHERDEDGRKYDVYNGEGEEESASEHSSTASYSEKATEAEFKTKMRGSTTECILEDIQMRHFTNEEMTITEGSDKRLDWAEPSYEDVKEDENKTEISVTKYQSTTIRPSKLDILKEMRENRKKWYTAEDLVYKKEINLLNSLDYSVARSGSKEVESEGSSKEGTDDKFSTEFK